MLEDADLDKAVEDIFWGCMYNMGQNCVASTRVLVDKQIYPQFVSKITEYCAKNVKIGDPFDATTNFGPLNNAAQLEKCQHYANLDKSLKQVSPQFELPKEGLYFAPLIYSHVPHDHPVSTEEIFGPVLSICQPIDGLEEGIRRANDSNYGLGAAIFSKDLYKIQKFVRGIAYILKKFATRYIYSIS